MTTGPTTSTMDQLLAAIEALGEKLAAAVAPNAWERLPYVLTVPQVAKVLGISVWTAGEYCRQNVIPHRYIGKRLLISRDRLREWLAEGEQIGQELD